MSGPRKSFNLQSALTAFLDRRWLDRGGCVRSRKLVFVANVFAEDKLRLCAIGESPRGCSAKTCWFTLDHNLTSSSIIASGSRRNDFGLSDGIVLTFASKTLRCINSKIAFAIEAGGGISEGSLSTYTPGDWRTKFRGAASQKQRKQNYAMHDSPSDGWGRWRRSRCFTFWRISHAPQFDLAVKRFSFLILGGVHRCCQWQTKYSQEQTAGDANGRSFANAVVINERTIANVQAFGRIKFRIRRTKRLHSRLRLRSARSQQDCTAYQRNYPNTHPYVPHATLRIYHRNHKMQWAKGA